MLRPFMLTTASLLLLLLCALPGCKVSGEFDPDLGKKDDDTVYRSPVLPQ
jgi:hypothetical protein